MRRQAANPLRLPCRIGRSQARPRTCRCRRPQIFIGQAGISKRLSACFKASLTLAARWYPGSASYDAGTQQYTIRSAGYNIWYSRDEFRFLWKKMSGDVSLAADVTFPDPKGYGDRKVVLIIRQNLEDDSKEAMLGEHGVGMIHLAWRPEKGAMMKDAQFRFGGTLAGVKAKRMGIEKHGDAIAIFVSLEGEPMHQLGPTDQPALR